MNGDKMPFGQRSAGTIIQIPRHLPDWAPSKLPELPAGDMNTDYHPFPPIVICGGLKTNKWFIENSRDHAEKIISAIIKS